MSRRSMWRVRFGVALCLSLGFAASGEAQNEWDWAWGELIYGRIYQTTLKVTNNCKTPQRVSVTVEDPLAKAGPGGRFLGNTRRPGADRVPEGGIYRTMPEGSESFKPSDGWPLSARMLLDIPAGNCSAPGSGGDPRQSLGQTTTCFLTVPPGQTDVEMVITTPPPLDLSNVILPPGFDPNELYDEIEGMLKITPVSGSGCWSTQDVYWPSGHVHLDPDPAPPPAGPRCRDWWDTEQKPRGLTRDCTGEIRDLALTYLRTTLAPLAAADPKAWAWLPAEDAVLAMTVDQLIAMKTRARTQMNARADQQKGAGR